MLWAFIMASIILMIIGAVGGVFGYKSIQFIKKNWNPETEIIATSTEKVVTESGTPLRCWRIQWCPWRDWRYADPKDVCDYGWEERDRHGIRYTTENVVELGGMSSSGEYCEIIE